MNSVEKEIKHILDENIDREEYSYFLFWSQVSWNSKPHSDYDVGILWTQKMSLQSYIRLKRKLNDTINYPVDLVDFNRVGENFFTLACKHIKLWNRWRNIELLEKHC